MSTQSDDLYFTEDDLATVIVNMKRVADSGLTDLKAVTIDSIAGLNAVPEVKKKPLGRKSLKPGWHKR